MKTALTELIEKWENETGSYIPNAPIYKAFIAEAKEFLEREKQLIILGWIDGKETKGYGYDVFTDAEFYYHKKYIESEM